jgi:hypothetical protein
MELSTPELKVFKAIIREPGIGIKGLVDNAKFSKPNVYYVLRSLKSKRLIESDGKPARYSIHLGGNTAVLSRLFKLYWPYPVEKVLSSRNYPLLKSILHGGKTADEVAEKTRISKPQVYKIMSKFSNMGLVRSFNDQFYISSNHPLYKCLLEYGNSPNISPDLEQNGVVFWQSNGEYLVQTDDYKKYTAGLKKPWRFTSTSAVAEYGVHIIPPTTTLYVADQHTPIIEDSKGQYTNLEDTIIFTLLHDTSDSKTYARYMMLLHKDKIKIPELRQKARKYGITKTLESIFYDLKPVMRT